MRIFFTLAIAASLSLPTIAQNADQHVSMKTLNAVPRENQVLISWNPEQADIVSYHVERSKNGTEFIAFSEVQGANGIPEFLETDFTPLPGLSYYRITAISAGGTILYSNIVPVKFSVDGNSSSPLPANATGQNTLREKSVLIIVRNKDGNEFYSKVEVQATGDPVQCKDPEPFLEHGTYTIVGCSEQELYSRQIIVN